MLQKIISLPDSLEVADLNLSVGFLDMLQYLLEQVFFSGFFFGFFACSRNFFTTFSYFSEDCWFSSFKSSAGSFSGDSGTESSISKTVGFCSGLAAKARLSICSCYSSICVMFWFCVCLRVSEAEWCLTNPAVLTGDSFLGVAAWLPVCAFGVG